VATLSKPIITALLRHQLGYDGVVFTDDMDMRAISARHEPGDAAILALRAGVDIMLFCHDLEKAVQALECLCAAVEREPALRAQVEASHRRIGALKQRRLRRFTGVAENELEKRLKDLDHPSVVEAIYGNL
jgi:beta-N-acetylhexosaminidase